MLTAPYELHDPGSGERGHPSLGNATRDLTRFSGQVLGGFSTVMLSTDTCGLVAMDESHLVNRKLPKLGLDT